MNDEFEPRTEASPAPSYGAPAPEPKKEKKHMSAFGIIALVLCFTILGGAAGFFGAGRKGGEEKGTDGRARDRGGDPRPRDRCDRA